MEDHIIPPDTQDWCRDWFEAKWEEPDKIDRLLNAFVKEGLHRFTRPSFDHHLRTYPPPPSLRMCWCIEEPYQKIDLSILTEEGDDTVRWRILLTKDRKMTDYRGKSLKEVEEASGVNIHVLFGCKQ